MKQTINMRQQLLSIRDIAIQLEEPHKTCRRVEVYPSSSSIQWWK